MFPLIDTEPNRYSWFPFMTISLIAINTFIEIAKPLYLPGEIGVWQYWEFMMRFYYTPKLILSAQGPGILSGFTSMFMHGNFAHLLSNMWALWVFGRRVEDACGAWRFLVYYLLAGISADFLTTLVMYNSPIPGVGASGAIFGVMGAYLLLYPAGRDPHLGCHKFCAHLAANSSWLGCALFPGSSNYSGGNDIIRRCELWSGVLGSPGRILFSCIYFSIFTPRGLCTVSERYCRLIKKQPGPA